VNKYKTPRDPIYALEYKTKSKNMAQLARNYHHDLLQAGLYTPPDEREIVIAKVLASVLPDDILSDADSTSMGSRLSKQDVLEALKSSKNETSTGINGLPYKLWKILHDKYETDTKTNSSTFNIVKALSKVYNDIEEHGVVLTTNFTEG
jgi:hypothetical protein